MEDLHEYFQNVVDIVRDFIRQFYQESNTRQEWERQGDPTLTQTQPWLINGEAQCPCTRQK